MNKSILITPICMLWLACGSPCDDLDCGPNGTCDEDSDECMCDPFYEGVFCELETRANYLGRWTGIWLKHIF